MSFHWRSPPPILLVFILLSSLKTLPTSVFAKKTTDKKLIYYGWGIRDTQYIRDHWREMEAMPFDGVGIVIPINRQTWQQGKISTANQLGWQVMGQRMFRLEEFLDAIRDLRTAKWRTFTDNFLPIALSASQSAAELNWFDDERWRIIVNNFSVLARIAVEGSFKGLIIDPEHYGSALFSYRDQRKHMDRTFKEFTEFARLRGRQIMAAISAHLPDAVLLSLFGYTLPLNELRRGISLKKSTYSLLPAFYDGLLETMPAGAYLVDGYEFAYGFKERRQFLNGHHQIYHEAVKLSQVPDLYGKKVKAGFGLWLDYRNEQDYFSPEEFKQALSKALEASDKYVWIYSHKPRFFPPSNVGTSYIEAIGAVH